MSTSPRRGALTLGFANGLNALSQGSLIAFVALFSNEAEVGSLAAAIAVTTPIMFFVQGRVQDLVATSGHAVGGALATLRRLVATGILWGTAASVLVGLAFGLNRNAIVAVVLLALARGVEAGSQLTYGYRLHRGDPGGVARSLMLRSFLTVAVAVPALIVWPSSAAAGFAMFSAWLMTYLFLDRRAIPRGISTEGIDRATMRGHSRRLGAVQALSALIPSIPRLGLLIVGSTTALGRFAIAAFVARAMVPVSMAGSQALGPAMAAQHRDGQPARALRQAVWLNLVIAIVWIPAGFLLIDSFVPQILGRQYEISVFAAVAVLVASGSLGVTVALEQSAIAAKQTWRHLAVLMLTVVACLVATLAVIPMSAIDGAAFALLTANLVRLGAMIVLVRFWIRAGPRA